jgi:hypothetical protein
MCSSGMQYRQVVCRQGHETLSNTHCDESSRPFELQACHVWNSTICSNIRPVSPIESSSSYIWDVKQFGEVRRIKILFLLCKFNFFLFFEYFSVVQPVVLVVDCDKFIV